MVGKLRIDHIFFEEMKGDKSFTEKPSFFEVLSGGIKYTQQEAKGIWHQGIRHGIEIGLRKASLEGQRIELSYNSKPSPKSQEFIEKLYALCGEYECAIQYHPELGMVLVDRKPTTDF